MQRHRTRSDGIPASSADSLDRNLLYKALVGASARIRGRRDTVDLVWLVIPAAVGIFLIRTAMIARRLKTAAANPTLTDVRALRDVKARLGEHRGALESAVGAPKDHLEAAKRLSRPARPRTASSRVGRMVEDFAPPRRF